MEWATACPAAADHKADSKCFTWVRLLSIQHNKEDVAIHRTNEAPRRRPREKVHVMQSSTSLPWTRGRRALQCYMYEGLGDGETASSFFPSRRTLRGFVANGGRGYRSELEGVRMRLGGGSTEGGGVIPPPPPPPARYLGKYGTRPPDISETRCSPQPRADRLPFLVVA